MDGLTHASFFSGVGGLDMGLERAGWRTVSFSEIDPYASAVLAQRWPGAPNLGSITELEPRSLDTRADMVESRPSPDHSGILQFHTTSPDWHHAALWSGGFPCQDLSVAGKRRGMVEGSRSGLAYAFLDLVERHRPPAVLLENVPGLLSSHDGRDLGSLVGTLGQLGYGWAYRVLDAQFFDVPQRRRRVFILGIHARIDPSGQRAAEVLSVGTRCGRHPATGHETGEGAAAGADERADESRLYNATAAFGQWEPGTQAGTLSRRDYKSTNHLIAERPSSDPDRDGAPDGLAGRTHHRDGVDLIAGGEQSYHQRDRIYADLSPTLDAYGDTASDAPIVAYVKRGRAQSSDDAEPWGEGDVMSTLNAFDVGDVRTTAAVLGTEQGDDPMLPLGLDSHRYRTCGNGVVSNVAEWIGLQLAKALA